MERISVALLLLLLYTVGLMAVDTTETNSMVPRRLECKCNPGTRQLKGCTKRTSAVCLPCKEGQTYQSKVNNDRRCKRCSVCGRKTRMLRNCSVTQDTRCACVEKEHFYEKLNALCRPCKSCSPGEGITRACTFHSDRECSPCGRGTFSSSKNNFCKQCSTCGKGSIMIKNCTSTRNTVCETVLDKQGLSLTTILLAIFSGVIAVVVIIYLCFRIRKRCLAKGIRNTEIEVALPIVDIGIEDPEPREMERLMQQVYEEQPERGGLLNDEEVPECAETSRKVKQLPFELIADLGLKLNGKAKKNWKNLAGAMGYSLDHIRYWEQKPLEATENLLKDFATRKEGTLALLYKLVLDIGRWDVAKLFHPCPTCGYVH